MLHMNDRTPSERGFVPQPTAHLTDETIEQIADGILAGAALQRAEAHLEACSTCAVEVEASRAFFAALSQLPGYPREERPVVVPAASERSSTSPPPPRPLTVVASMRPSAANGCVAARGSGRAWCCGRRRRVRRPGSA